LIRPLDLDLNFTAVSSGPFQWNGCGIDTW